MILTDGPTGGLGYMAEALRNNGLDAGQVQFLGMQRWDTSAEILDLDSVSGGAFAAPDPALIGFFNGRYLTTYGEQPHALAGLAFDGVAAVGAMIADARADGLGVFSAARLTQPQGFAGSNGPFRLLPDGTNQRNLAIYRVENGRANVVRSASRGFDQVGY